MLLRYMNTVTVPVNRIRVVDIRHEVAARITCESAAQSSDQRLANSDTFNVIYVNFHLLFVYFLFKIWSD